MIETRFGPKKSRPQYISAQKISTLLMKLPDNFQMREHLRPCRFHINRWKTTTGNYYFFHDFIHCVYLLLPTSFKIASHRPTHPFATYLFKYWQTIGQHVLTQNWKCSLIYKKKKNTKIQKEETIQSPYTFIFYMFGPNLIHLIFKYFAQKKDKFC